MFSVIYLPVILGSASIKSHSYYSYLFFLVSILINSFRYEFAILNGKLRKSSIPDIPVITPTDCAILVEFFKVLD